MKSGCVVKWEKPGITNMGQAMEQKGGFSPWADEAAFQELYRRLRSIARARMAGQASHTLTPTGLVNEVMLKMLGSEHPGHLNDESHFIATASTAMRHIMVDHARRKAALKRTNEEPQPLHDDLWIEQRMRIAPEVTLDVAREMDKLAHDQPELVKVVEMRVFGGLTFVEIGALLGMETKTAERRWRYASALLRSKLEL
jgi:RNA polymerase sigma factor (TIGR02999 family)